MLGEVRSFTPANTRSFRRTLLGGMLINQIPSLIWHPFLKRFFFKKLEKSQISNLWKFWEKSAGQNWVCVTCSIKDALSGGTIRFPEKTHISPGKSPKFDNFNGHTMCPFYCTTILQNFSQIRRFLDTKKQHWAWLMVSRLHATACFERWWCHVEEPAGRTKTNFRRKKDT